LLSPGGLGQAPRFSTLGIVAAFALAVVLPLLMYLAYARDEEGPLGLRRAVRSLVRYPVATLLALTLLPLGVVAAEMLVSAVLIYLGQFRFMLLELFPDTTYFAGLYGIQEYGNYTRPYLPDSRFWHFYLRRLYQGYALTTAFPASLSAKTAIIMSPWTLELTDGEYLRMRLLPTEIITATLAFFAALQSRWLGAISRLESARELEAQA
jgi:hypothetical protein